MGKPGYKGPRFRVEPDARGSGWHNGLPYGEDAEADTKVRKELIRELMRRDAELFEAEGLELPLMDTESVASRRMWIRLLLEYHPGFRIPRRRRVVQERRLPDRDMVRQVYGLVRRDGITVKKAVETVADKTYGGVSRSRYYRVIGTAQGKLWKQEVDAEFAERQDDEE